MERRDFLKLASSAGLALAFPSLIPSRAEAAIDGPLFVFIHADGGWDPTSLCDPKGFLSESEENPMNKSYAAADIGNAGNIRFAPVGGNQAFFEKHHSKLLVVNGIDTETNSHDSGTRNTWSGRLGEGWPALSALIASVVAKSKPMAFLTAGGYDYTAGLVAPTRTGNLGALTRLAYPNRTDPNNPDNRFHTEATAERIAKYQRERLEAMMEAERLPRLKQRMGMLHAARMGDTELKRLTEFLPETLDNTNNPLRRQAQVAIAGYRAGITAAVNLSYGGFDTHGNHDNSHIPRLQGLLEGVDFLFDEAEARGVADRLVVAIGSDFGRTPGYNEGNGKDHWSITSMILAGPGIPGNRVIGETDERHRPIPLDPTTLKPADGGIRIKPAHVHQALRRLAGIEGSEEAARHPLHVDHLPLFG